MSTKRIVKFEIYRYDPDKDERPYMQKLEVELQLPLLRPRLLHLVLGTQTRPPVRRRPCPARHSVRATFPLSSPLRPSAAAFGQRNFPALLSI